MAIFPDQQRSIDPYSSYHSNVVNKMTRMVTGGRDCLFSIHGLDVKSGLDPQHLILTAGQCFKDDVIIEINNDFTIDLAEPDHYVDATTGVWNEEGVYYIVLEYTYVKARPAPKAEIKIIKPTQHVLLTSKYLFLKAVEVIFNSPSFEAGAIWDHDPADKYNVHRDYTSEYVGVYDFLPPYVNQHHEGMMVYDRETDLLYYGTKSRWQPLNAVTDIIDTTNAMRGQLGNLSDDGKIYPAIATSEETLANCFVLSQGTVEDRTGQVQLLGFVPKCKVESGISLTVGNDLYLSTLEGGTVTNVKPKSYGEIPQYIGKALENASNECDIWFQPGSLSSGGTSTGSSSGLGDEYLIYHTLLEHSTFEYCHFDVFDEFESIDTVVVGGDVKYDFETTSYVGNGATSTFIESPAIIPQPQIDPLLSFLMHFDTIDADKIDVYYQIDTGDGITFDGVWRTANKSTRTLSSSEFRNLKFKFVWNANSGINDEIVLKSYGVLYGVEEAVTVSRAALSEFYTATQAQAAGSVINIPNYGVFTYDGKSLEVFWNRVKAIRDIDYTENTNRRSITLLKDMDVDDVIEFRELYGYVDVSIENSATLEAHTINTLIHTDVTGLYIPVGEKGVTNGVATLNSNTKVPNAQLPIGDVSGVCGLDGSGKIPPGNLPAIAITESTVVATITARNALTAQEGDVAIVTDSGDGESKSYIYDGTSWLELKSPSASTEISTHESTYDHNFGNAAYKNIGTSAGTVATGDHGHPGLVAADAIETATIIGESGKWSNSGQGTYNYTLPAIACTGGQVIVEYTSSSYSVGEQGESPGTNYGSVSTTLQRNVNGGAFVNLATSAGSGSVGLNDKIIDTPPAGSVIYRIQNVVGLVVNDTVTMSSSASILAFGGASGNVTPASIGAAPSIHTHPATEVTEDSTHRFVTDAQKTKLADLSAPNGTSGTFNYAYSTEYFTIVIENGLVTSFTTGSTAGA